MAIRKIRIEGDPCLTKKCRTVTEFDARLHQLLDDMRDTLLEANGVGLAAPQVGILRRVVVVNLLDEDETILELVNPTILEAEGAYVDVEGCLSVPDLAGEVERPEKVTVRAQDRYGEWFEYTGELLLARCFCHECDHLDGHLYVEKVIRFVDLDEEDD